MGTSFWTGERVRLRAVEADDWGALMRLSEEEQRFGDLVQAPRSAEAWREKARRLGEGEPSGDHLTLVVEALDTGEAVGTTGWHAADPVAGSFEYGVTIGADHRRKGYASEAVTLLLRFMFAERRHHRCQAQILAYNEGSLVLHRRLGFTEEGRRRDAAFAEGRHHDIVVMGMLADEFAQRNGGLRP
jgi:RimJ/RimL family protein N-acetyltransferase